MSTSATTDSNLVRARAAADAAVGLLPASTPLTAIAPTTTVDTLELAGQAVCAKFNGAAQGEVVVVVGQDLVDALRDSPLGSLDVAQAVRPAIEAAAATMGPVIVDPGRVMEPAAALSGLVAAGGAAVPLTDGAEVRAIIGIAVSAATNVGSVATPHVPAQPDGGRGAVAEAEATGGRQGQRPALDLLHDVEMEVTAELGRTRMSVRELLGLVPGAVVELDRAAGGPADLLVNGRLLARGEVVVIDENFGIRITEIVAAHVDRG